MIIAVDYDDTLVDCKGKVNWTLIKWLKQAQWAGDTVILWTCREAGSLAAALIKLRECGFAPNFVNCNSPERVQHSKCDPRKIYADIYIDDKAIRASFKPEDFS